MEFPANNPSLSFAGSLGDNPQYDVIFDHPFNPTSSPTKQSHDLLEAIEPLVSPDHVGFLWTVQAIGPENLAGIESTIVPYFVQPPRPDLLSKSIYCSNEQITLQWDTPVAPHEAFSLEIYDHPVCFPYHPDTPTTTDRQLGSRQIYRAGVDVVACSTEPRLSILCPGSMVYLPHDARAGPKLWKWL